LGPAEVDPVILAVNEAAANAIEHGYRDAPGEVTIEAALDEEILTIEVLDHGTWRDGPPDPARGRGLTIMRTLADEVEIDRGDGGTSVRLRHRLRVAEPPAAR
jgi:serine/threonine-protein kinase RsbW